MAPRTRGWGWWALSGGALAVFVLVLPGAGALAPSAGFGSGAPYPGFHGAHVLAVSAPATGCGHATVRSPPRFNATTGVVDLAARVAITTACTGWAAGGPVGPNSTSASLSLLFYLNRTLNASAILGANTSSGTVLAAETWSLSLGAAEHVHRSRASGCAEPYRGWMYGCEAQSRYAVGLIVYVWDASTRSVVASSPTYPSDWGAAASKIRCTTWGAYCSGGGGDHSINQTTTVTLAFDGTLRAADRYVLVAEFDVQLGVEVLGWQGTGAAHVDLATNGHGATLTALRVR